MVIRQAQELVWANKIAKGSFVAFVGVGHVLVAEVQCGLSSRFRGGLAPQFGQRSP